MKHAIKTGKAISLAVLILGSGCEKPVPVDAISWSQPTTISHSRDSLGSSFTLYRWNNSLLALNGDTKAFSSYFLNEDGKSWKEKLSNQSGSWAILDADAHSNRVVICRGLMQGDKLDVDFLLGSIHQNGSVSTLSDKAWSGDKTAFFGKTSVNITLSQSSRPQHPVYARGVIDGPDVYIPYSLEGESHHGKVIVSSETPYSQGTFFSLDSGITWQREQLSKLEGDFTTIRKTENNYYYFLANRNEHVLYYSSKVIGNAWTMLETVNKTLADYDYGAFGGGDTIHLCWLDRRHEKTRLNPVSPNRENYEVAYCNRKDSDASWSKDVILSEGLLYAYSPSISVEGDKVVVVWAGVKNDKDGRNEYDPSDIFYATSKDGGKNWTRPMQVTDGFKAGITSGRPQVALHNGVIHLFYIQGKLNYREVSSGMAKLNQPPWPICYQQRPFPD
jgi:hypothetical protein